MTKPGKNRGGRPATGQIPHRAIRIDDADWEALGALYGRRRGQVLRDLVAAHLGRPGAKPPRKPSPKEVAQADAETRARQAEKKEEAPGPPGAPNR